MQLIYKDEKYELKREKSAFNEIFLKVNDITKKNKVVFSHLIVDGEEVYESHEQYINERLNEVLQIQIITRTTNEMIIETMHSVEDYLARAIPTLNELIEKSYDQYDEKVWKGIGQLAEGLEWLLQFKTYTASSMEQPDGWEEFEQQFSICEQQFTPLLEAIEMQDSVFITDILAYEITPAFEEMLRIVKAMLQDETFKREKN